MKYSRQASKSLGHKIIHGTGADLPKGVHVDTKNGGQKASTKLRKLNPSIAANKVAI